MKNISVAITGRKIGAAILAAGVATCIALAATSIIDHRSASHRFVSRIVVTIDGWRSGSDPGRPQRDVAWVQTHREVVLAEGHRACQWLSGRPDAPPVDPSGQSDPSVMAARYMRETPHPSVVRLAHYSRWALITSAWDTLCTTDFRDKTSPRSSEED